MCCTLKVNETPMVSTTAQKQGTAMAIDANLRSLLQNGALESLCPFALILVRWRKVN